VYEARSYKRKSRPELRAGANPCDENFEPMVNVNKRVTQWSERLNLIRAVVTIVAVAVVLVLIGGAVARLVEPETFTSLGLAYWWAITTVTTVGYGDVVPEDAVGRIVGALLMLTGLSLIPTLTSVVVSTLISKRSRAETEELRGELLESTATLRRIEERLARMEGGSGLPP
jgi:voltage-gated potassium channel